MLDTQHPPSFPDNTHNLWPSSHYTTFKVVGQLCSSHYTTSDLVIRSLAAVLSSYYRPDWQQEVKHFISFHQMNPPTRMFSLQNTFDQVNTSDRGNDTQKQFHKQISKWMSDKNEQKEKKEKHGRKAGLAHGLHHCWCCISLWVYASLNCFPLPWVQQFDWLQLSPLCLDVNSAAELHLWRVHTFRVNSSKMSTADQIWGFCQQSLEFVGEWKIGLKNVVWTTH